MTKQVNLPWDVCRCLGEKNAGTICAERELCKRYLATFTTGGERVPYTSCLNPSPDPQGSIGQPCPYKIELED